MVVSCLMAGALIFTAVFIGIIGYRYIAGFDWIDSLLEASMILGGMGGLSSHLQQLEQKYLRLEMRFLVDWFLLQSWGLYLHL
jgi:hypothetical protein